MTANKLIRENLERTERELIASRQRTARLEVERDVLRNLLSQVDDAEEKMGPTDAVRRIVRENPGVTRDVLIERAVPIVTTAPEKARETVAQTIRNLYGKGEFRIDNDGYYLTNNNGHRE